jgi:hypothetical protein
MALAAPASHVAEVTPRGFLIRSENWRQRREVDQVSVEVRSGSPPRAFWRERRKVRGDPVQYRSFIAGGGSGGEEHVLQVWRARPDGYLWLEQVVQSEWGNPSFDLGWQILDTVGAQ